MQGYVRKNGGNAWNMRAKALSGARNGMGEVRVVKQ